MCEAIIFHLCMIHKIPVKVSSAGTRAHSGDKVRPKAIAAVKALDVFKGKENEINEYMEAHRSKNLEQSHLDSADVIICMEKSHRDYILEVFKVKEEKVIVFEKDIEGHKSYFHYVSYNYLLDPQGQSETVYERTAQTIHDLILPIVKKNSELKPQPEVKSEPQAINQQPSQSSDGPRHILFVCTGNTIRSPMGEAIMHDILRKNKVDGVEVLSAGTAPPIGEPQASESIEALRSIDIKPIAEHKARKITQELVDWADIIFCMTLNHRQRITTDFKRADLKVRLLCKNEIQGNCLHYQPSV
jgi:protein-tyrosine phosphatase